MRPTHRTLAITATIAALILPGCIGILAHSGSPERDWQERGAGLRLVKVFGDPETSGTDEWSPGFDNTIAYFDINRDGTKDVVGHGMDRRIYVYNGRTGELAAKLSTPYPPGWHVGRVLNSVAVEVLTPGGQPSLIVANPAAVVTAWTFDPVGSSSGKFEFKKVWQHRLDDCHDVPGMDAGAVVADVTGDGKKEILIQTEELGLYALNADGSTLWRHCWGGGNADAAVGDLDGDGRTEVVFGSDAGEISVFDGATGVTRWVFSAQEEGIEPASITATPTIAELDGQAPKEIIATARQAESDDPDTYEQNHMAIFAVREASTGYEPELLWLEQPRWANPMMQARIVAQDVDRDGSMDLYGMDWNTIGHLPGDWEPLGPANLFRMDHNGDVVWVRQIDAWWSNKDVALTDVDGDGKVDILANGPSGHSDGLWLLDAETGNGKSKLSLGSWRLLRGAQIIESTSGPTQVLFPVETDRGVGAVMLYEFASTGTPVATR